MVQLHETVFRFIFSGRAWRNKGLPGLLRMQDLSLQTCRCCWATAEEIHNAFPGIKGFNRRGLYRMKKFYETYVDDEFVTTLLSQISWSNHLAIISKAKHLKNASA